VAQDGVKLKHTIRAMVKLLKTAVVLPSEDAYATLALWTAHTWVFDQFPVSPYLFVNSPAPRCGKTRVLEVLERVVARPWRVVEPTEAVLFRKIERNKPTLLLDEVDTYFQGPNERTAAVRALLNAGNARGVTVPRCEGKNYELREFSIYCPKAFAGIGKPLPDTVLDRAIMITLQRATPAEQARIDRVDYEELEAMAAPLREVLERWSMDPTLKARLSKPVEFPPELDARARQCWRPLLAVAREAGMLEEARRAAVALSGGRDQDTENVGTRLLLSLREIFEDEGVPWLPTSSILKRLREREEEGWEDLNAYRLARILKGFGVKSEQRRALNQVLRGYSRSALEGVFSRYIPQKPLHPLHVLQPRHDEGSGDQAIRYTPPLVADPNRYTPPLVADTPPLVADGEAGSKPRGEGIVADVADVADSTDITPTGLQKGPEPKGSTPQKGPEPADRKPTKHTRRRVVWLT
jgi:hypothetical protein